MLEMHAKFQGQVQGVGFRATARQLASQLGLKGFVRNTSDGGAEIRAQGEKKVLEELLSKLQSTFTTTIHKIEYMETTKVYDDFSIIL